MTQYANYKYYKEEYTGTMPETDFDKMSKLASVKIKTNTFGRINENNVPDEVKQCVCALADELFKTSKIEGKTSESVGSWSVSYLGKTKAEENNGIAQIIKEFLGEVYAEDGTPLLYRGC